MILWLLFKVYNATDSPLTLLCDWTSCMWRYESSRSFSPSVWCSLHFKASVSQPKLLKHRERTNNRHDVPSVSSAKPFTLHQQILLHFFLSRCQTVAFCPLSISVVLVECCSLVGDRTWIPPAADNRWQGCVQSFSRTCFSCSITPQASPPAPPITPPAPLFTSTCIREDHSGLLQFGRFFCRDEAAVELVAQAASQ